ncbi:ABC transporter permease [bacterium]|nr:ABC transporter permease [bacterium]
MRRLLTLLRHDIRLQWRHGFYGVYIGLTAIYILALRMIPDVARDQVFTLVLFSDPAMIGFYFVGGSVLLERDQRTVESLFVTPIRTWEYLASKVVSLTLIALLSSTLLAVGVYGIRFHGISLLLGVGLTSVVFTLFGLTLVSFARSLNHYFLLSAGYMILFVLPFLSWFGLLPFWISIPFPTTASLVLIDWIRSKQSVGLVLYGIGGMAVYTLIAWHWASNWFESKLVFKTGRIQ